MYSIREVATASGNLPAVEEEEEGEEGKVEQLDAGCRPWGLPFGVGGGDVDDNREAGDEGRRISPCTLGGTARNSSLTVTRVSVEDLGSYSCVALNRCKTTQAIKLFLEKLLFWFLVCHL